MDHFFLFASLACIVRIASALAAGIRFVFIYQMIPRHFACDRVDDGAEWSGIASANKRNDVNSVWRNRREKKKRREKKEELQKEKNAEE